MDQGLCKEFGDKIKEIIKFDEIPNGGKIMEDFEEIMKKCLDNNEIQNYYFAKAQWNGHQGSLNVQLKLEKSKDLFTTIFQIILNGDTNECNIRGYNAFDATKEFNVTEKYVEINIALIEELILKLV